MRADNSHHVIAAAHRRAKQTRQRALTALRRMNTTGQRITFDSVAREARVSRSWLYAEEDLRAEIERLRRPRSTAASTPTPPLQQRASEPSLLRRLEAATTRIRTLEADNQQLRDALARALGEHRAAEVLGRPQTATRRRKNLPHPSDSAEQENPGSSTTPSTSQTRRSQA